jgi:hypothetical protein
VQQAGSLCYASVRISEKGKRDLGRFALKSSALLVHPMLHILQVVLVYVDEHVPGCMHLLLVFWPRSETPFIVLLFENTHQKVLFDIQLAAKHDYVRRVSDIRLTNKIAYRFQNSLCPLNQSQSKLHIQLQQELSAVSHSDNRFDGLHKLQTLFIVESIEMWRSEPTGIVVEIFARG